MPRSRLSFPRPRPPAWVTWVLSFVAGAALLVALVLFVDAHNTDSTSHPANSAEVRQALILIAQDQAPHVLRLTGGARRTRALTAAIAADIGRRIKQGTIDGQLQRVSCRPSPPRAGRVAMRCVATVSNVNYDYDAVIDTRAQTLTFCRRDVPPVPTERIPLSPLCEA